MVDKLPAKLQDHFLVQYILGKLVNQVTNCELVKDTNIDEIEDYPFFTFHWIDLSTETTGDWLGKHRQYKCTMQIDSHAASDTQAMVLSQQLYEALHEVPYRRFFSQCHILPDQIGNTGNRTVFQTTNYDNDYGFDCSFYITGGYEFKEEDLDFTVSDETIESVKASESVNGSKTNDAINVFKNKEEK